MGHGCGHNLIAAAAVGAGLVLARAARAEGRGPFPGGILVIGTPAEETIGGKAVMVRERVFDGVDAALMIHPSSQWRVYVESLACASIEVTYLGRESHAVAWPEKGINALDALIQMFVAVDMLRKRLGNDVKVPGVILEGGARANIIPARAVGAFSLRAPTTKRLLEVREAVERTARSIAEATGCRVEIRQTDNTYDDMLTNHVLARRFKEHLQGLGVETMDAPRQNMGSLDMGNVSRAVPSVHVFIRVAPPDTPLHSASFARATVEPDAEAALLTAVKALALTGYDVLAEPELLRGMKTEFEEQVRRDPS
jgi:amidohydrolase